MILYCYKGIIIFSIVLYTRKLMKFSWVVEKIHSFFWVEIGAMKSIWEDISYDALLELEEWKSKRNMILAYLIRDFRKKNRTQVEEILGWRSLVDLNDFIKDSYLRIWYLLDLREKTVPNSILKYIRENDKIIEWLKKSPAYIPSDTGLTIIKAWMSTALKEWMNAMNVYLKLWWKKEPNAIVNWTKEFLNTMASLHVDIIEFFSMQIGEWYSDIISYVKNTRWWLDSLYDPNNFYIDQQWALQLKEGIYRDWILKLSIYIEQVLGNEPVTKCPALFAKINSKNYWKTTVFKDMLLMMADRTVRW